MLLFLIFSSLFFKPFILSNYPIHPSLTAGYITSALSFNNIIETESILSNSSIHQDSLRRQNGCFTKLHPYLGHGARACSLHRGDSDPRPYCNFNRYVRYHQYIASLSACLFFSSFFFCGTCSKIIISPSCSQITREIRALQFDFKKCHVDHKTIRRTDSITFSPIQYIGCPALDQRGY